MMARDLVRNEESAVPQPLARASGARSWWWRPLDWLRDVPIADPVDRRNAPVLQMVSLLLATLPPLAWFYRAFLLDIPWRPGESASMALSLSVSAVAAASFVLVRRGNFVWASNALLLVFAVTVIPAYLATGFGAQRFEQPVLVIWMAIAGLIVGRAALWIIFLCVVIAFFAGIAVDIRTHGDAAALINDAANSAAMFLMIALVLDRSSVALRESLREAKERGDALAVSNLRLVQEMAERERAHAQLIQAQKIEAVGRLVSGVAHDFGNLVMVMGGHARRGMRSGDAVLMKESLAGVDAAVSRATMLTRRLMSFSRQEDGAEEWFDSAEALSSLRPMVCQLMGPAVRLDLSLAEDLPSIYLDRTQFELMVLNIAANAEHAMPNGGTFAVSARSGTDDALVLELSDTGSGMDEAVLARIFEPFFTTKPRGQGTGLGLSVVRDLIVRAGGSVAVRSAPGDGTTFVVTIPGRRA